MNPGFIYRLDDWMCADRQGRGLGEEKTRKNSIQDCQPE